MQAEFLMLPELLHRLRLSRRTYERMQRAGRWPIPELQPRIGSRPRFPVALVEAYLAGTTPRRTRRVA